MDIWVIGGIIIFGLLVIMVEIFLVPGTTVIGVIGGIIVVIGVVMAYIDHGAKTGSIALAFTSAACGVLLYFGFKAYTSRVFSLNDVIDSRVNIPDETLPNIGDEGVTISYLRPHGKALINKYKMEVYSQGDYINSGVKVRVIKIAGNKVYVQPVIIDIPADAELPDEAA